MRCRTLLAVAAVAAATVIAPALLRAETPAGDAAAVTADQKELHRANQTVRRLRAQLRRERARHATALRRVRRAALARPSVQQAIDLGSAAFGVPPARLRSVALCESRLDPAASNGQYLGLFQFGSRLWDATPFRAFSRSDPYAASFAAAWAFSRGMARHWPVCGA
ncbi:MAG: hypothetical protein AB1416_04580 [Actinomycetota bacterium]